MGSLDVGSRMHFIVDGCGNYYRINGNDQLVVADSREEAGVFSFVEANHRIGGGKKAHFYSAIPVDEEAVEEVAQSAEIEHGTCNIHESEALHDHDKEKENLVIQEADTKMVLPYDIKSIDWNEYLTHFCYIASGIQSYQDELVRALSDVDMQICDIMHYIELYDLDENDSIHMVTLLKECREQRRDVKDELVRVECFQRAIGSSGNIAKAKDSIKQIKKLDSRVYRPRKLQKLFESCPEETQRGSKLKRAFEGSTCMDIDNMGNERREVEWDTEEEGVIMEDSKQKTIFDGKENDWKQFARQQAEFYANAEQYIYNLQEEVKALDEEMEQTMLEMERANYNVTQGYKVFKHLKELRMEKKKKSEELECLYILTERFDCREMTEVMEECVGGIEAVIGEMEQEREEKLGGVVVAG